MMPTSYTKSPSLDRGSEVEKDDDADGAGRGPLAWSNFQVLSIIIKIFFMGLFVKKGAGQ